MTPPIEHIWGYDSDGIPVTFNLDRDQHAMITGPVGGGKTVAVATAAQTFHDHLGANPTVVTVKPEDYHWSSLEPITDPAEILDRTESLRQRARNTDKRILLIDGLSQTAAVLDAHMGSAVANEWMLSIAGLAEAGHRLGVHLVISDYEVRTAMMPLWYSAGCRLLIGGSGAIRDEIATKALFPAAVDPQEASQMPRGTGVAAIGNRLHYFRVQVPDAYRPPNYLPEPSEPTPYEGNN